MTSGPQDPQQGGYGQSPYGPPGGQPQGGQPEYGQPQYGQQPQGGGQGFNPYPSAPQGQEWDGPPSAPTERPTTVKAGIGCFVANVVLSLIGLLLLLTDMDGYKADLAEASGTPLTDDQVSTAVTFGIGVTVLILAAFAVVIWFAWQGRNWARIVLWVLGGISVLFGLLGAGTMTVLSAIGLVLTIAGIVLLALKPSNQWYRAEGQRRQRV